MTVALPTWVLLWLTVGVSVSEGWLANSTVLLDPGIENQGIAFDSVSIRMSPGVIAVATTAQNASGNYTGLSFATPLRRKEDQGIRYSLMPIFERVLPDILLTDTNQALVMTGVFLKKFFVPTPTQVFIQITYTENSCLQGGCSEVTYLPSNWSVALYHATSSANSFMKTFLIAFQNASYYSLHLDVTLNYGEYRTDIAAEVVASIEDATPVRLLSAMDTNTGLVVIQVLNETDNTNRILFTNVIRFTVDQGFFGNVSAFKYSARSFVNCTHYVLIDVFFSVFRDYVIVFECRGAVDRMVMLIRNRNPDFFVYEMPFYFARIRFAGITVANKTAVFFWTQSHPGNHSVSLHLTQISIAAGHCQGHNWTTEIDSDLASPEVSHQRNHANNLILAYKRTARDTSLPEQVRYLALCMRGDLWFQYADDFLVESFNRNFGYSIYPAIDSVCNIGFLIRNDSQRIHVVTGSAANFLSPLELSCPCCTSPPRLGLNGHAGEPVHRLYSNRWLLAYLVSFGLLFVQ